WWGVVERAPERPGPELEGLGPVVQEVARFLDFKGMPIPDGAELDVLVSRPGQRAIEWPSEAPGPRLWGGINLGEEAFSLVFVNRTTRPLRDELADRSPAGPDELVRRFLASCPEYPLVRLRVGPGEGYRLPADGLPIDVCTQEAQGPSVMLAMR